MTQRKYNGSSIPVRVYTTRGLKDQARFALEYARRTVDYFSEIFRIDYPLPKSDLLAVHEFVSLTESCHRFYNSILSTALSCFLSMLIHIYIGNGSYGELGSCNI